MNENNFSEEDKSKVIKFLNAVYKYAKFNDMTTEGLIEYYGLLSFMQKVLLNKIDSNILEVKRVVEAKSDSDVGEE